MRTKHLIVALLVIVSIFVTRGFYVVQEVNEATEKSYHEFEVISNNIAPLKNLYVAVVASTQVKAAHGLITPQEFLATLNLAEADEKKFLENYAKEVQGNETVYDRELFIQTLQIHSYVDRLQLMAEAGDVDAIHKAIYSGEMSSVFLPAYKTLNKISSERLISAANYKVQLQRTIHNFETVLKFSGTLILILAVLVVRYKEYSSSSRAPFKSGRKKTLKTRAAN
jgi:hypothetical protein